MTIYDTVNDSVSGKKKTTTPGLEHGLSSLVAYVSTGN